ncbi:hypothetical protein GRX03_07410 [Halovenus sp. WSH3]|uniref:Tubulin/FtsZ GTPase domain-containing protein n=1 Tax=Halovenus carboxidivorans TaxID=2692199 RepID=A0A6B0TE01_9EURY|nr:tubulin-like doman-containing protein [Halovenus carboxidivorans]MXR51429.1 hypothetical protein [Halovenus carboxidivorans]
MNLPDKIFAVGGAGKAIALELLEAEWILEDLLEPRPDPSSLTVTIIDTAEGEKNTDQERIHEIRQRIQEKEEELRDPSKGRTGTIEVEYKLITEDIHLSGSIDLIGDDAVPRIAAGNGMDEDNWWIEEEHINENLDFAKGVVRKRGLGKAIYYKAYAEDDQISSYIDLSQKGKVAIIAGLGGGTGSGILLDLAQHLQERQRTAEITLFGILPNHTEGIKENTNAFAALSELEYDALSGNNVFKDRILIPIDPTDFDGKIGNRLQSDKLLEELDEAILYLLTAYYNTEGLEDPFADTPSFAPFTIGIPQVLRYNVEAINDSRGQFREVLTEKDEALQHEAEIYNRIDRFLTRHYDPDSADLDGGLRDLDETDLKERLEDVESWLDFELFDELEYHSLGIFEDIIADAKSETDDVVEQIDIISGSLRAVDATSQETGTFVDNIDERLAEILEQDLTMIVRRKELLQRRQAIEHNRIRDAVEYLMGIGDATAAPGVKLQRLEAKYEDIEDTYDELTADLEDVTQRLEEKRDEQSAEIERQTSEWMREVEADLEQLQRLDTDQIQAILSDLMGAMDRFVGDVVNAASHQEVDQARDNLVLEQIDRLGEALDAGGVAADDHLRAVSGSLTDLKRAKKAFLTMNQEEGTLESITPWKSDTEERREEANKDYRIQKNNLAESGVFQVGPPTGNFNVDITFDTEVILDQCRRKEQRLRETAIDRLRSQVEEIPPDEQESLETELGSPEPDIDRIREIGRSVIRRDIGETDQLEQRRDDLQADLDEMETEMEVYGPAIDLFQEVNNRRENWEQKTSSFQKKLAEQTDNTDRGSVAQSDDYVYLKNVQPNDIFRATGRDDIAESDLFSSEEENQRLRSNLEELAQNARREQYTGLLRRKLDKGTSRYSDLKVRVAVSSPAVDQIDSDALDFEDTFRDAFDLGASGKRVESPFTSWPQDSGGPWDIGLSVFITGVFLDNIRKVVQADGYYAGYEQKYEEENGDLRIHHSYGLEDGIYVRRKDLLNLETDDDVAFYLRDQDEIVDDLLNNYVETVEVGDN